MDRFLTNTYQARNVTILFGLTGVEFNVSWTEFISPKFFFLQHIFDVVLTWICLENKPCNERGTRIGPDSAPAVTLRASPGSGSALHAGLRCQQTARPKGQPPTSAGVRSYSGEVIARKSTRPNVRTYVFTPGISSVKLFLSFLSLDPCLSPLSSLCFQHRTSLRKRGFFRARCRPSAPKGQRAQCTAERPVRGRQ